MPMPISPVVCVGLGQFGIDAVRDFVNFLLQRRPEALAFIRAHGFAHSSQEPYSYLPHGRIENNELKLTFERWITQLSDVSVPCVVPEGKRRSPSSMASIIREAREDLAGVRNGPDHWPVTLGRNRPRVVLVGALDDPLMKLVMPDLKQPTVKEEALAGQFFDSLRTELKGLQPADVAGIFFTDRENRDGQLGVDLESLDKETKRWENHFVALLVSRVGIDLNQHSAMSSRVLWTQSSHVWDAEYTAGARLFARALLLLLLRATEEADKGLAGELFRAVIDQNTATRVFSIALGMEVDPKNEAVDHLVSQAILVKLDNMINGPFGIVYDPGLSSQASRPEDAVDAGGEDLFSLGRPGAGQPPRNILDGQYHRYLVEYFTKDIKPENSDYQLLEHPQLARMEQLNLQDFVLSDRAWWTRRRLPLEPEELLSRLRKACLQDLRNAVGWNAYWKRLFEPGRGWAKASFDKALRRRLDEQASDLDLLVARLLDHHMDGQPGGLECAIQVLEGMSRAIDPPELEPRTVPPEVPEEINMEFAKEVRHLVWSLRVREPVRPLSALFYCLIGAFLLSIGLSYFVKGFYHQFPEPLVRAILSFAIGPFIGAAVFIAFRLRQIRELKKLQRDLSEKKSLILRLLNDRMREIAEGFRKNYLQLYRIRCQRSLSRRLNRLIGRLKSYRQIIRDRKNDLEACINSLQRLPAFKSSWIATPFEQNIYDAALGAMTPDHPLTSAQFPLPGCDEAFEKEPLRNWLSGQVLSLYKNQGIHETVDTLFAGLQAHIASRNDCLSRVLAFQNIPPAPRPLGWNPRKGLRAPGGGFFIVGSSQPSSAGGTANFFPWDFDDITLIGKSFLYDIHSAEDIS